MKSPGSFPFPVIFEGPDKVGKGTQIKRTLQMFADDGMTAHVLHYSSVKFPSVQQTIDWSRELYREMFSLMHRTVDEMQSGMILDRSHLGEWVYGKIYRRYDANFIWEIERNVRSVYPLLMKRTKLVMMLASPETLVSRDDGQSHSNTLEDHKMEVSRFRDAFVRTHIPQKLMIDTTSETPEESWKKIKEFLHA